MPRSFSLLAVCALEAISLAAIVNGQSIAIFPTATGPANQAFLRQLGESIASRTKLLDRSMTETAFASVKVATPFNLTLDEAKLIGKVGGADFFLLANTGVQRRASLDREDHFEAFAAVFVASSRSGRLVFSRIYSAKGLTPETAETSLAAQAHSAAEEISTILRPVLQAESVELPQAALEEVPEADSPAARGFRAPVPYRRIKPEYTRLAYLYSVTATVDVEVDLDEKGQVIRTGIKRWAGFGLDESVITAVRSMNWRPAERNGRSLPMRILLRYNFKKSEADQAAQ